MLTKQELRLKRYLGILSLIYFSAIAGYLLPGIIALPEFFRPYTFLTDPAFVNNSVVKIGLFAFLCFVGYADVRKFRPAVFIVILAMLLAEITSITLVLFALNNYVMTAGGSSVTIKGLLWISIVFDGSLGLLLYIFYRSADSSRYNLKYLSTTQFRTLEALASVILRGTKKPVLEPHEVAYNVDNYLSRFEAGSKWITKLVLTLMQFYPLATLNPPLSYMERNSMLDFLKKRFYRTDTLGLVPGFISALMQAMIRMSKQLCYMGYYNDTRVFSSIGYVPFSKRDDTAKRLKKYPPIERKPLVTITESMLNSEEISGDVVVIGSGAGGSVIASGLLEKGRSVLMLERGRYVPNKEFTEDEMEMISSLYSDGAIQLARDFRFQVIQGSCVGGTTVVNNAVCFKTPDEVIDVWNDKEGLNACIDRKKFSNCLDRVWNLVDVKCVDEARDCRNGMGPSAHLNPSGVKFMQGLKKLGLDSGQNSFGALQTNITSCLGCGYCNIGCSYGKKLSMMDTVLPEAQSKYGSDALRIVEGIEVLKLISKGKKITAALCRFKNGKKVLVKGKTFVVSAGAISSSLLLIKSGIAGGRAGKRLSFNIGSTITAVFPEKVNAYAGLQISHYLKQKPDRRFVLETWYNPPMFQSIAMPGWFEDHYENMLKFDSIACAGILVGSESNGEVSPAGLTGRELRYSPTASDLKAMLNGLETAGKIFLAAGAERVMPNTFLYNEFRNEEELSDMSSRIKKPGDITLGTGHPQGGNILSCNKKIGVVNPELRVYDYDNLFVADASVFPTSVRVNPQITVMAFADYAVEYAAQY